MESLNNSPLPNNLPPDMWEDHPTTPPSPAPTPMSAPPTMSRPAPMYTVPRTSWWRWWLTLIIILGITGGFGYVASRYWTDVAVWVANLIKTGPATIIDNSQSDNVDDQVAWQQRELIGSLNLMKPVLTSPGQPQPSETPSSLARYYKVGQFVSGPYQDQDLVIAALIMFNDLGGPTRFYYFAKNSQNKLALLAKHSPELYEEDGIDHNKFTIDTSYQIARLFFPDTVKNPRTNKEPLVLVSAKQRLSSDQWFDELKTKLNWQKVFIDQMWGDVYTDPMPTDIWTQEDGLLPTYGFYLAAPDGTVRIYKLVASVLSSQANENIPFFSWKDGSSSTDAYIMFEMTGCGASNLAAVMPPLLLDELAPATSPSYPLKVYELKDKNHDLLKDLFAVARTRFDNKGLTYQKFLNNHPIFFWQDSFGRLIKFQNRKYVPLVDGCS
ncbi:TPA: hypothetical protein DIV45_00275 [Patescibacteria group bacterium]|nr:hypothetical protein [Patescibacteria group bacterium]